jgi:hypothetical protein
MFISEHPEIPCHDAWEAAFPQFGRGPARRER